MAQYDINLREYWRILKKRKFVVFFLAIILGVFATSFAILQAPTPLYTSVCSIKFEKQTPVEGLFAKTITWSRVDDIETQAAIIKSYFVLQRVAEKLQLIPQRKIKEGGFLDQKSIRIIENLQSKVEVERQALTNILDIRVTDPDPVFARKLANMIASTYKELHSEKQMKRTRDALKYIDAQLKKMGHRLKDSEDEFNRYTQNNQLISIATQGEDLLVEAREIRVRIREFKEVGRELKGIPPRLNRFIENPTGLGRKFYSRRADEQYQNTNSTLVELLLRRDSVLEEYTAQHPEVMALKRKIIETAKKMSIQLQLQISDVEMTVVGLQEEQVSVDKRKRLLMEKKLEFGRLKRKVELHNEMTALLEKKNQEALIRKAEKPEEITVVKPALLPGFPTNPPKTGATGAMGVIIGLVLGMVIAFLIESFDTSLGAIEDVEEILGTQVLGVIPQADFKDVQESLKDTNPKAAKYLPVEQAVYLTSHFAPLSMLAESFRALRTNIQFKDTEKKIKAIAITSTSPQEGKTMVSINLAITLAQAGVKVLLVGADLRMPMMCSAFGVERSPGLTDILLGNYPWRETVKTVTDLIMGKLTLEQVMLGPGLDNLHIITSGEIPLNPAELIDSPGLVAFLEDAKKEYDMVMFDTTPILSAADAAILGTKMDGVLLVYRLGVVSRALLKRSSTQLKQVNCNILGVALNGMKPEFSPDFQDYKYYKYRYAYGAGKKNRQDQVKRISSIIGRKRDSQKKSKEQPVRDQARNGGHQKKAHSSKLRLSLLALALILLGGGALWHNGILDLSAGARLVGWKKETVNKNALVKRKVSVTAIEKGVNTVAFKTRSKIPSSPKAQLNGLKAAVEKKVSTPVNKRKTPPKLTTASKPPPSGNRAPVKTPSIAGTNGSYPYSVYLGSFRTPKRRERAISIYSKKDLSLYWVKVKLPNGVWYRVFSGHFKGQAQAEKFIRKHGLKEAKVKKTRYATLIGIYSQGDGLDGQTKSLREKGYSPYVIKDRNGKSRLVVGAFLTKKGAQRQHRELKSKGVKNQVISR